jgi:lipopolysaccharide export system protein LptA
MQNRLPRVLIGAAAALATAVVLGVAAQAQIMAKGGNVEISADHSTADNNAHIATYSGRVEVLQGANRLRADLLNIYFKEHGSAKSGSGSSLGNVDRYEAIGNVFYVTPTQVIRGDKAVYTQDTDTLVVTGQVVLRQGQNVMVGTRLTYVRSTGKSSMESDTGRVRSVLYPDDKPTPGG